MVVAVSTSQIDHKHADGLRGDVREHRKRSDRCAIFVFVLEIRVVAMMLLDFGFELGTQTRRTVQGNCRIAVRHGTSSRIEQALTYQHSGFM